MASRTVHRRLSACCRQDEWQEDVSVNSMPTHLGDCFLSGQHTVDEYNTPEAICLSDRCSKQKKIII